MVKTGYIHLPLTQDRVQAVRDALGLDDSESVSRVVAEALAAAANVDVNLYVKRAGRPPGIKDSQPRRTRQR